METEPSPSSSLSSSQQQQPVAGPSSATKAQRPSSSSTRRSASASTSSHRHDGAAQHCSFVLLAEFDIDRGSTLSHVYPSPELVQGHDDHALAELMLPDGAHARSEDWTTFFLPDKAADAQAAAPLTYVLNLVRTKHDASVRRGALVKAIAIGSRRPCLRVFKPILLLALDEYFANPTPATLAKLYDAINSLDLSSLPTFSRAEKLVLRSSERKDLFADRFAASTSAAVQDQPRPAANRKNSLASMRSHNAPAGRASPFPFGREGGGVRDTHVWETSVAFGKVDIPIRWPLDEWEDEVGEYSLSLLFQTFASHPVSGPLHAHLHSNGSLTHPMTLLFNALVTYKRVIFLGHGLPAATVASHVLAAAALGGGCGAVIPGFKERVHPYANLISLDTLEETPGFVAGVTNPRFEELRCWDVLCNIETGKITVAKTIEPASLPNLSLSQGSASIGAAGGIGSLNGSMGLSNDPANTSAFSSDSIIDLGHNGVTSESAGGGGGTSRSKVSLPGGNSIRSYRTGGGSIGGGGGISEFGALTGTGIPEGRNDSPDSLFMEEVAAAVSARFSEVYVRARITEYVSHFARLVTRHEEQFHPAHASSATAAVASMLERFPHQPYLNGQLGSGIAFGDRDGEMRELAGNAGRIEGFRSSPGHSAWLAFDGRIARQLAITDVDVWHQISRLRGRGRAMHSAEAALIFSTLVRNVKTEAQIVELLSYLPSYSGGLSPLALGLFHSSSSVRNPACDLLARLTAHSPAGLKQIQTLPVYYRLAFARARQERADELERAAAAKAQSKTTATAAAAANAHQARATPPPWSANSISSAGGGGAFGSNGTSPTTAMSDGRGAEGRNGAGSGGLSAAYREMGLAGQQQ